MCSVCLRVKITLYHIYEIIAMPETIQFHCASPEQTASLGASLALSLYPSVDILLYGELGAGKTTFLQGLAQGLGVQEPVNSPTYALEQRYHTKELGEFIHIDLYRLENTQADDCLVQSDDHKGIRCIEWAERLQNPPTNALRISIQDSGNTERMIEMNCDDLPLPSESDIQSWRREVGLPENVIKHCEAVGTFACELAESMQSHGQMVRPLTMKRAGQLHDLFRFLDFTPGAAHDAPETTAEQKQIWETWREKYPNLGHEAACAQFLRERGYVALGDIVEPHGLTLPSPPRPTIEQQLLFYADKRVRFDEVVSLDERFADFQKRYSGGAETERGKIWLAEAKDIEKQLFPLA